MAIEKIYQGMQIDDVVNTIDRVSLFFNGVPTEPNNWSDKHAKLNQAGAQLNNGDSGVVAMNKINSLVDAANDTIVGFTITAGTSANGQQVGYSNGDVSPAFGVLDEGPIPEVTVIASITSGGGPNFSITIVLSGDIIDEVSGKSIWIGEYEIESPTWQYTEGFGTYYTGSSPIMFVEGNTYTIEIGP